MMARASASVKYGISVTGGVGQGPTYPRLQSFRQRCLRQTRPHKGVKLPAEGELVAARQTGLEVCLEVLQHLAGQGTVEVGEELPHRLVTRHGVHGSPLFTNP